MEKISLKIGEKGKKYGLIAPKKIFEKNESESSESEENNIKKTNKDIVKASLYKQNFTPGVYQALAEDPTIFSYDLYKSKLVEESLEMPSNKDPKYHETIKKIADFKKKEREVIKERVEIKMREREKQELGETEVYYTQSYLNLMKENKIFEEKLETKDIQSELHSIEHKNPDKFLNNLISNTSEPYKKQKIEDSESQTPDPVIEKIIPNKRSESELICARDRYLLRKKNLAQVEAKMYVDSHNLEKIIGDMLNAMVYAKDPHPTVFMIKYLANLASVDELRENGISIASNSDPKALEKPLAEEKIKIPSEVSVEPKSPSKEEAKAEVNEEEVKEESLNPESQVPEYVPKAFPNFGEDFKGIVKKTLDEALWNKFLNVRTKLDHDLYECVSIGVQIPAHPLGIYAADADSYEVFAEVFVPVVEEAQNWRHTNEKFEKLTDVSNYHCENLDESGKFVTSVVVSVDRNLLGYSFPIAQSPNERLAVKKKVEEVLEPYLENSMVKLDDSRIQDEDSDLLEDFKKKYEGTDLVKDWPDDRGVYYAENLLITVNLENHLRILCKVKGGDLDTACSQVLGFSQKLHNRFEYSEKLGFLTTSPSNIGTGLLIKVKIYTPEVIKEKHEFHDDRVSFVQVDDSSFEVFNTKTIGVNEIEIVKSVENAVKKIIDLEKNILQRHLKESEKAEEIPYEEKETPKVEESHYQEEIVKEENEEGEIKGENNELEKDAEKNEVV